MTASAARQVFYGIAAITGLVLTWYFNLTYDGSPGYLRAWFANAASSSAAVDLLVLSAAAGVFVVTEGRRLGMRRPFAYVVLGVVVAMAFAVPLFLLVRERTLEGRRGDGLRRAGESSPGS